MRILAYLMGDKIQPTSLSSLGSHATGIFLDRTPGLPHFGHCRGQRRAPGSFPLTVWSVSSASPGHLRHQHKVRKGVLDSQNTKGKWNWQLPTQVLIAPLSTPCGNPSQEVLRETHSVSFMTSSSAKVRKWVAGSRWITVKLFLKVAKGTSWRRDRISNLQSSFPYTSLLFGHKRYMSSRKVNGSTH